MSRYRHRYRRNRPPNPEELFGVVILLLVLSITYPPVGHAFAPLLFFLPFFILFFAVFIFIKFKERQRILNSGITEIDEMSGQDFEIFLVGLFSKLGYKVEHTGKTGDFGVDLVIELNDIRTIVQAKRYKEKVGEDAVREAYSAMYMHNCILSMVVTNSYYTPMAKELAKSNNVALWDRNDLVNNILKSQETIVTQGNTLEKIIERFVRW